MPTWRCTATITLYRFRCAILLSLSLDSVTNEYRQFIGQFSVVKEVEVNHVMKFD